MKRTKGFTLVELLVVVAIIALLVSILLPTLGKAKELAKRALCGANLNGVGKGIVLYQSESNDSPPWIDSDNWGASTGTNARSMSTPDTVSPTALMFLIIRSGQPVAIFRCPSDDGSAKMGSPRFSDGGNSYYYWDFYDSEHSIAYKHAKMVSYSFQAPLYNGTSYTSGVSGGGSLAIMADKTPKFGTDGLSSKGQPCTDWTADPMTEDNRKDGMSRNHGGGDFINVLFADAHVKGGDRADVGISRDNIYSASGSSDEGTQGAGVDSITSHRSVDDSYLIGPQF